MNNRFNDRQDDGAGISASMSWLASEKSVLDADRDEMRAALSIVTAGLQSATCGDALAKRDVCPAARTHERAAIVFLAKETRSATNEQVDRPGAQPQLETEVESRVLRTSERPDLEPNAVTIVERAPKVQTGAGTAIPLVNLGSTNFRAKYGDPALSADRCGERRDEQRKPGGEGDQPNRPAAAS